MNYAEIMAEMYFPVETAMLLMLVGAIVGGLLASIPGMMIGGVALPCIAMSLFTTPMVELEPLLAELPHQQEKAAIIAEATNIDCCLYRDAEGNYFFLHEFNISEKDFAENGPKFIRVDIPMEDAPAVMAEMGLLSASHDCNIHYDFTPIEEAVRIQYLSEHPEMADDYVEESVETVISGATQVCRHLYIKDGQYFMVDEELTTRTDVSEEEAYAYIEDHRPNHVHG